MLGMVDEIEVESDIEFNRLLSVISQRLVGKLCPHCKSITHLEIEQINGFDISPGDDIYQANGCPECLQSGFRGRTGLYEMIEIDDSLSTMIHDGACQSKLEKYCRTRSHSLREDGIRKVLQGETTLDEVLRVTGPRHK